jgi:hypothetical protein
MSIVQNPKSAFLPVGSVRQHHMTCVPATLATISRYWSMPTDHLSAAEAICYDGTPPRWFWSACGPTPAVPGPSRRRRQRC